MFLLFSKYNTVYVLYAKTSEFTKKHFKINLGKNIFFINRIQAYSWFLKNWGTKGETKIYLRPKICVFQAIWPYLENSKKKTTTVFYLSERIFLKFKVKSTVKPVLSSHTREAQKWLLEAGGCLIEVNISTNLTFGTFCLAASDRLVV